MSTAMAMRLSTKWNKKETVLATPRQEVAFIVWFDDPKKEHICEETGEEVILAKDKKGRVIGFEKLNYLSHPGEKITSLPVEVFVS